MDDLESRIAELFTAEVGSGGARVVDLSMVERVISQLGMPDGSEMPGAGTPEAEEKVPRKLYRDLDDKRIAGVCSSSLDCGPEGRDGSPEVRTPGDGTDGRKPREILQLF